MAKGRIDSLFDLEAIRKEIAAIGQDTNKFLDELAANLQKMASGGVDIGKAGNFKELNTATKEYNAYVKQTENVIKQLADTEAKLLLVRQKETAILTEQKLRLKELNKEQSDRIRIANAEKGSIEELSLKYDKAYRIYKQLSEAQRDTGRGQALNKFLADTSTKLKELEGSVGNFRRNVGNYAGSLAKPFETLVNKLDELKSNLKNGLGLGGNDVAGLQRANEAITIIETALDKSSAAGTTTVKQVRNLSNAFTDLSVTIGKADSTTFLSSLGVEIGEAKDAAADLRDELKLNASDTKGIDNVVGSLNALAGVAQGAAGAYALLGANEEDAAKVTSKLIAVQGIANSIQQVGTELTRKGTIANKIYELSLNTMSTAFGVGSTAAQRFNAILKVGVVGLVITGLVLLISKIIEYRKATDDAAASAKEFDDVRKEGLKNAAEELTKVKLLYEASQNQTLSLKDRKKAVDELQEQYPKYFKNLTDEEILAGKAATAYDNLSKNIIKTGLAQAAKAKITEISAAILDDVLKVEEANKRIQDIIDGGVAIQKKIQPATLASGNKVNIAPITFSTDQKDKDKAISAIKTTYAEAFAAVDAGNARIKKIIDGVGAVNLLDGIIGDPEKAKESAKKLTDNTLQTILKEQFEQKKILLQRGIDADRKVFEDETKIFSDRLDALKTFTAGQMNLVNLERNFEIESEKLRLAEVVAGLEEQKKEKGANIKAINEQIAKETEASNVKIETIVLKSNENLIKLGEEFNKDLKILKEGREGLRKEEEKDLQDYEEFTMGWLKAFRQKQYQANIEWDKADLDREKRQKDELRSIAFRAGEEMQATFLFFLTASIDKEMELLEKRQRLIDEDIERRINQIELLGLKESERIRMIAEVEKQAMFETEQIEKRKRKLAYERARFEKFANIASIITSTAQAVVAALGQKPWTPFNIAMATIIGGMGVLQLARAVAAPLPQYFKGTDSAKKGLAIVSEEGPELMKRNGQLYLTPAQPTLMEMAGGEQITPAHLTRDILNSVLFTRSMQENGMLLLQPSGMSKDQADQMIAGIKELKSETAKSRLTINWQSDNGWNAYIQKNVR